MADLRSSAQSGVSAIFVSTLITQAGQFVFGLILARLLEPKDYGLIGMLAIFIGLSDTFVDSGLGTAIIRKKEPVAADYSTVFWYNVLISASFYIIIVLSAPFIAAFYGDNQLILLTRVLSLIIIINAIGSIQGKYLNKNLKYTDLAKVAIVSFIGSSAIAVLLAWFGFGVWALVGRSISLALLLNGGWWIMSRWKPTFKFSKNSFKELFGYGSKLLFTSLFDTVFNNFYSVIIGKLFSADKLGYYNRAKQFQDLPDRTIRGSFMGIFFPILSQIQDDGERLLKVYKKLLSILIYILYPVYSMMFLAAYPLIEIILKPKWLPAAPLLQILCLVAIAYPFQTINENILYLKGRSDYVLYLTIIRRVLLLGLVFGLFRFGVEGLLWGLVAEAFIGLLISSYLSNRLFSYKLYQQVKDNMVIISFNLIIIAIMFFVKNSLSGSLLQLLLVPSAGVFVYLILSIIFKRQELKEVIDVVKKMLNKSQRLAVK